MKRSIISFLILLPNLLFGQKFYLEKEILLEEFPSSQYFFVESSFSRFGINVIGHDRELKLLAFKDDTTKLIYFPSKYYNSDLIFNGQYSYQMLWPHIYIKDEIKNKEKRKRIKSKSRKADAFPSFAFEDEANIYFIYYYNKEDRGEGHDHSFWLRINKSSKKMYSKSINLGTEIIFAPFNFNILTFNGSYFVVASILEHKLLLIDKDFNIKESIELNEIMATHNKQWFDSTFSADMIRFMMHKPKDLIDYAKASGLYNNTLLNRVMFLNDSLLLTVSAKNRYQHMAWQIINLNTRQIIANDSLNADHPLSPVLKSNARCYSNYLNQLVVINEEDVSDTSTSFIARIYRFTMAESINKDSLKKQSFWNPNNNCNIDNYDAVLLADDSFCKGCYSDMGVGEGVLVICKDQSTSLAKKHSRYKYIKKDWHINGGLVFVDDNTYQQLEQLMLRNTVQPTH